MAIRVASAHAVRRHLLRRLPARFRPARRGTVAALGAALAVATLLAAIRVAAPAGPLLPTGPLLVDGPLQERPVELIVPGFLLTPERLAADEGWLRVPGDHADPDPAASVQVHFTLLPMQEPDGAASSRPGGADFVSAAHAAAAPAAGATPIVWIGDGGAGAVQALLAPGRGVTDALRTLGPVIAFDPRDSAHAEPAPWCPGDWALPIGQPLSLRMASRAWEGPVRACAQAAGAVFAGVSFDPGQSVGDLESLRSRLGVPRLRLLAAGEGTRLALAYLARHPARVERALLLAPQLPAAGPPRAQQVEAALGRALAALQADPRWNRRLPEPRESLRAAIARLEVQPQRQATRDPRTGAATELTLGGDDLRLAVLAALARQDGVDRLGRLLQAVFAGDHAPVAESAAALRLALPPRAGSLARTCAAPAPEPSRQRREAMAAAFTLLGEVAGLAQRARCRAWPTALADPTDWLAALGEADAPVLLVAGRYDPATPLEQVQALASRLPRASVLVLETSDAAGVLDRQPSRGLQAMLGRGPVSPAMAAAVQAFLGGETADEGAQLAAAGSDGTRALLR